MAGEIYKVGWDRDSWRVWIVNVKGCWLIGWKIKTEKKVGGIIESEMR